MQNKTNEQCDYQHFSVKHVIHVSVVSVSIMYCKENVRSKKVHGIYVMKQITIRTLWK